MACNATRQYSCEDYGVIYTFSYYAMEEHVCTETWYTATATATSTVQSDHLLAAACLPWPELRERELWALFRLQIFTIWTL